MNPNKKRLRRTMMFLNAQKPGLIKDPYIYKPDSIMLDLEDAVAENKMQRDFLCIMPCRPSTTMDVKGWSESTDWIRRTGEKISAVR